MFVLNIYVTDKNYVQLFHSCGLTDITSQNTVSIWYVIEGRFQGFMLGKSLWISESILVH